MASGVARPAALFQENDSAETMREKLYISSSNDRIQRRYSLPNIHASPVNESPTFEGRVLTLRSRILEIRKEEPATAPAEKVRKTLKDRSVKEEKGEYPGRDGQWGLRRVPIFPERRLCSIAFRKKEELS